VGRFGRILAVLLLATTSLGATPDKETAVEAKTDVAEQALLHPPDLVRPNQTPIDQQYHPEGVAPGPAWCPKPDWTLLDELRSHRRSQAQQIEGLLNRLQAEVDRRIESVTSRVQRVLRVIFWVAVIAGSLAVLLVVMVLYWLSGIVQAIWGLRQTVKLLETALVLAGKLKETDGDS